MRLRDLREGEYYAKRFGYGSRVLKTRVDQIEKRGRRYHALHISYGPGFKEHQRISRLYPGYGEEFLAPWDEYKKQEIERREHIRRIGDVHQRINQALHPIGLSCRVFDGHAALHGDLDQMEELIRCIEDGTKSNQSESVLGELIGS